MSNHEVKTKQVKNCEVLLVLRYVILSCSGYFATEKKEEKRVKKEKQKRIKSQILKTEEWNPPTAGSLNRSFGYEKSISSLRMTIFVSKLYLGERLWR